MLISALPPVLVLHLNRVRYDAAAGGLIKIGKSIRFGPDLEIPHGTIFQLSRGSRC
jgi:ubiquitin carboxyl-terminal hydrolase 10